jgi:chromosome segregation ATPase
MDAEYQDVIQSKQKTARQIEDAIKGVEAQRLKTTDDLETATNEVEALEEQKQGAIALAQERLAVIGEDKVDDDAEYQQWLSAYNDADSTLNEKQQRIEMLEERTARLGQSVGDHMIQLQGLKSEIEKLAAERGEAVADVLVSREMESINNTLAGIETDGANAQLNSLRQRRREAQAGVQISQKLAGTDSKLNAAKMKAAARKSQGSTDFAKLVGRKVEAPSSAEAPAATVEAPQALPE